MLGNYADRFFLGNFPTTITQPVMPEMPSPREGAHVSKTGQAGVIVRQTPDSMLPGLGMLPGMGPGLGMLPGMGPGLGVDAAPSVQKLVPSLVSIIAIGVVGIIFYTCVTGRSQKEKTVASRNRRMRRPLRASVVSPIAITRRLRK